MEVLILFTGLFTILIIRWVWVININVQKAKKLLYAIAMLQYEQQDKENGAVNLNKIIKGYKSNLSDIHL
jgi:hypothetical protein